MSKRDEFKEKAERYDELDDIQKEAKADKRELFSDLEDLMGDVIKEEGLIEGVEFRIPHDIGEGPFTLLAIAGYNEDAFEDLRENIPEHPHRHTNICPLDNDMKLRRDDQRVKITGVTEEDVPILKEEFGIKIVTSHGFDEAKERLMERLNTLEAFEEIFDPSEPEQKRGGYGLR